MIRLDYTITEYPIECVVSHKGKIIGRRTVIKPTKTSKVIHNGTTTIVVLADGSKGVSKLNPCDTYNPEIGYGIAFYRAKIKQAETRLKALYSGQIPV